MRTNDEQVRGLTRLGTPTAPLPKKIFAVQSPSAYHSLCQASSLPRLPPATVISDHQPLAPAEARRGRWSIAITIPAAISSSSSALSAPTPRSSLSVDTLRPCKKSAAESDRSPLRLVAGIRNLLNRSAKFASQVVSGTIIRTGAVSNTWELQMTATRDWPPPGETCLGRSARRLRK